MIDVLAAAFAVLVPAVAVAALRRLPVELLDEPLPHPPVEALDDEPAQPVRRQRRAERAAIAAAQVEALDTLAAAARVVADAAYAFSDDPADLTDRDAKVLADATRLFGLALLPAAPTRH
jgi:hypothetical protein